MRSREGREELQGFFVFPSRPSRLRVSPQLPAGESAADEKAPVVAEKFLHN
jgi:hypothetical protein